MGGGRGKGVVLEGGVNNTGVVWPESVFFVFALGYGILHFRVFGLVKRMAPISLSDRPSTNGNPQLKWTIALNTVARGFL